jgi:adenylyltransferase/sulfurtransferase
MAKSGRQMVEEAKKDIQEFTPEEVQQRLAQKENFVLLDVRDQDEYRAGYIPGATYVSRGMLEFSIENLVPDKDQEIVAYCAGGLRSVLAAKALKEMGYQKVSSMIGGFNRWKQHGYAITKPRLYTPEQIERYSRHFMLPEVGEEGQTKLLNAKVLLAGAGGLGSPAAYYLAASGVGTLGIIDADVVDITNLQRQILHSTTDIGKPKVQSAKETITALNPDVQVIPYNERLTADNIQDIIKDFDIVVDGCDNFPTRYLINDACVLAGKPLVHGSIFQFEGQATVFLPKEGPCYRCLYPTPPPAGLVPS